MRAKVPLRMTLVSPSCFFVLSENLPTKRQQLTKRAWRAKRESSGFNFSSYPLPVFLQNKNHQNNMNYQFKAPTAQKHKGCQNSNDSHKKKQ